MGSWVRIPLEKFMSMCIYSVCAGLCPSSDLVTGLSPIQGVLLILKHQEIEKAAQAQQRAVEPWMDGWMDGRTNRWMFLCFMSKFLHIKIKM
jgi:hypothetical protein